MKRLTFEGNFCDISQCVGEYRMTSECADGPCSQRKVWERLKEYEDTGLEPEEIKGLINMLEFYKQHISPAQAAEFSEFGINRLRELAQADKDGRLVVLPCKPGEKVFSKLNDMGPKPQVCFVRCFSIFQDGHLSAYMEPVGYYGREYGVSGQAFGKTVFLTREEAEAALKGGADG